jgi:hypothetical protein
VGSVLDEIDNARRPKDIDPDNLSCTDALAVIFGIVMLFIFIGMILTLIF